MSADLVVLSALASATIPIAKMLLERIKLAKDSQKTIRLEVNGKVIDVAVGAQDSDRLVEALKALESAHPPTAGTIALSKKATEEPDPARQVVAQSLSEAEIGGTALAISPAAVFRDARRRINLVFMLNMGLSIVLAVILLGGIAGAIFSAVFLRENIWAAVFGGISVADLLGLYVLKPLVAVNSAIIAAQRLDLVHLRMFDQLKSCQDHTTLAERITCQTQVWKDIQEELAKLAQT